MNIDQFKQSVAFEAKIPDIDALGGWLDMTMQQVFNEYTAAIRYDELYVKAAEVTATSRAIPVNVQHLDMDNIRYRPGGDVTKEYVLRKSNRAYGNNTGPSRFVWKAGALFGLFPSAESVIADKLVFNYWKFTELAGIEGSTEIVPVEIVPTVLKEVIARALMFADSKQANAYRQLAKDAYVRSLGATDISSVNG